MIREIIRPQYTHITIQIPTEYIDRDVELLLFPIDREEHTPKKKTPKSLRGVFNHYADTSKVPLEDTAWQDAIAKKYKNND